MPSQTISLTTRSINDVNITAATMLFVVNQIASPMVANRNLYNAAAFTEAGDSANQLSSWVLSGVGTETYYWTLTADATYYWIKLYRDAYHTQLAAQGNRLIGNGVIYFAPYTDSDTVNGNVTVAYTADDADAANTILCNNVTAINDPQLLGATEFMYRENHGMVVKYTVTETVSAINTLINGVDGFLEKTISLTNAQITILNGTPVEVCPAPGAGYYLEFIAGVVNLDYGGAAITGNHDADLVTGTTGTIVANAVNAFAPAADALTRFVPVAGLVQSNQSFKIKMNTGDPTMGASSSTATVTVTYKITAL
jgi:hypothetical protein